jgi:hypothetical protein
MAESESVAEGVAPTSATRTTRRAALRRLGAAGAVAWTAPIIASRPAWAATTGKPPPPQCAGCGVELVANGSFETGIAPWTVINSGPGGPINAITPLYSEGFTNVAPPPNPGLQFADIAALGSFAGGLSQSLALLDATCAGHPYTLRFWWDSSAPDLSVRFNGSDGSADFTTTLTTRGVNTFTGAVPAGTTSVDLSFVLQGTGGRFITLFLDVVSFVVGC